MTENNEGAAGTYQEFIKTLRAFRDRPVEDGPRVKAADDDAKHMEGMVRKRQAWRGYRDDIVEPNLSWKGQEHRLPKAARYADTMVPNTEESYYSLNLEGYYLHPSTQSDVKKRQKYGNPSDRLSIIDLERGKAQARNVLRRASLVASTLRPRHLRRIARVYRRMFSRSQRASVGSVMRQAAPEAYPRRVRAAERAAQNVYPPNVRRRRQAIRQARHVTGEMTQQLRQINNRATQIQNSLSQVTQQLVNVGRQQERQIGQQEGRRQTSRQTNQILNQILRAIQNQSRGLSQALSRGPAHRPPPQQSAPSQPPIDAQALGQAISENLRGALRGDLQQALQQRPSGFSSENIQEFVQGIVSQLRSEQSDELRQLQQQQPQGITQQDVEAAVAPAIEQSINRLVRQRPGEQGGPAFTLESLHGSIQDIQTQFSNIGQLRQSLEGLIEGTREERRQMSNSIAEMVENFRQTFDRNLRQLASSVGSETQTIQGVERRLTRAIEQGNTRAINATRSNLEELQSNINQFTDQVRERQIQALQSDFRSVVRASLPQPQGGSYFPQAGEIAQRVVEALPAYDDRRQPIEDARPPQAAAIPQHAIPPPAVEGPSTPSVVDISDTATVPMAAIAHTGSQQARRALQTIGMREFPRETLVPLPSAQELQQSQSAPAQMMRQTLEGIEQYISVENRQIPIMQLIGNGGSHGPLDAAARISRRAFGHMDERDLFTFGTLGHHANSLVMIEGLSGHAPNTDFLGVRHYGGQGVPSDVTGGNVLYAMAVGRGLGRLMQTSPNRREAVTPRQWTDMALYGSDQNPDPGFLAQQRQTADAIMQSFENENLRAVGEGSLYEVMQQGTIERLQNLPGTRALRYAISNIRNAFTPHMHHVRESLANNRTLEQPSTASPARTLALNTFEYAYPHTLEQASSLFDQVSLRQRQQAIGLVTTAAQDFINRSTMQAISQTLNHVQTRLRHEETTVQSFLHRPELQNVNSRLRNTMYQIGQQVNSSLVRMDQNAATEREGQTASEYSRNYLGADPNHFLENIARHYEGSDVRLATVLRDLQNIDLSNPFNIITLDGSIFSIEGQTPQQIFPATTQRQNRQQGRAGFNRQVARGRGR